MTLVLEASNLSKSFGSVIAARNINLRIEAGEIVAVIGSNGAGKTTFVNMVTGYLKPTSGKILVLDKDTRELLPREIIRLGVGRSFQIPQVFSTMSVLENAIMAYALQESAAFQFFRKARTEERVRKSNALLKEFGIHDYADASADRLPQGVRKLLDIAVAMVHRPRFLLLDEPTSGISADEKFPIMDTIMRVLREQGVTVLFVEHDMDIVCRYVKRAIAFYAGEIIADGHPDEVLANRLVQEKISGGHSATRMGLSDA